MCRRHRHVACLGLSAHLSTGPQTFASVPTERSVSSLDVTHIKHHWKCILTSWHIEENGLDVKPVYNFLEYFGVEYPDGCIAPRPAWVSLPTLKCPTLYFGLRNPGAMTEIPHPLRKRRNHAFQDNRTANSSPIENVSPTDLQRFLGHGGGMMANDELINIFVAIGNYQ
ncbi:hypothetical protein C8J57DRAFT_1537165 [Mycena rebaudengoi]|nr:hypothetical protein C8J57DRAFT_1537165 [Mycena rebaudengoi]